MKAGASLVLMAVCVFLAGCSSLVHGSPSEAVLDTRSQGMMRGLSEEGFGTAVTVHAHVAVVGAMLEGPNRAGAAYVYRFEGEAWHLDAKLEPDVAIHDGFFGSSVAVGEDWLAVAARNEGAIYLYRPSSGGWELATKLSPTDSRPNDRYGTSLMLDGNRLAFNATSGVGPAGEPVDVVYLYDLSESSAVMTNLVTAPEAQVGAQYGGALALSGDTLVVGASNYGPTATASGAVYIYDLRTSIPTLARVITAPVGLGAHAFGATLALEGDLLAIGAPGEDYGGYRSGPVLLFERIADDWERVAVMEPTRRSDDDHFGSAMALIGGDLLVSGHTDNELKDGSAYVLHFKRTAGRWVEESRPLVSVSGAAPRFVKLASDGETVLFGSPSAQGGSAVVSYAVTRSTR